MSDVKISVIMPAYNVEQYIQKAIDSVLGQNYSNYELIIVDDGSTDNTGLICDQYTKRDLPIKVIHQENAGQSVARNVGIDYAEGDYICFLDSDDWYSANIFNVYNETINKYNPDIVQVSIFNVSDESSFYVPKDEIIEYNQKESLYQLIKNRECFGCPTNKLYKREIFQNLRFPTGMIFEDLHISIDVLSNINKLVFNKNACAYYRHRSNSTITSKFSKRKLDELLALEHINEVYLRLGYTELFDQNMSLYLSKAMNLCVKIKNSDLTNKETLYKEYCCKVNNIFKSKSIFRWCFKDIKRYIVFTMLPKIYESVIYRQ